MEYQDLVAAKIEDGSLPKVAGAHLVGFYFSFKEAVEANGHSMTEYLPLHHKFLELVLDQVKSPFHFEAFHRHITEPFDYQKFGIDLFRPLILFDQSSVRHPENLEQIIQKLKNGDNVILLANHQTEPDPQVISLLLEKTHHQFAEELIFVAGSRVISDPLAVPFSKGRNLLCIYSKKHIEQPPELKGEKLLHNKKTMMRMRALLAEGGKCIYVAPSGGRDRPNSQGVVEVAPFDPLSIEMFWLIAQQIARKTHFYPLAMSTYQLLPPPNSVVKTLGERRHAKCCPVHIAFGKEIDMTNFNGDKHELRSKRAEHIWNLVNTEYQALGT